MGKGFFKLPHFLRKLLSHPSVIFKGAFHQKRPTRGYLVEGVVRDFIFKFAQCDFQGGLSSETADTWLSRTAVVAGNSHRTTVAEERHSFFGEDLLLDHVQYVVAPPPNRHAQEHVQLKEWSGTSSVNLPMAVTKVFLKGHPKHLVLKQSCRRYLSTIAAPSCNP